MSDFSFTAKGHKQLASYLRGFPQRAEKAFSQMATAATAGMKTDVDQDVRSVVNVRRRTITERNLLRAYRRRVPRGFSIFIEVSGKTIPIEEFVGTQYRPGKEAGIGSKYGAGVKYTLRKGDPHTRVSAFRNPSQAGDAGAKLYARKGPLVRVGSSTPRERNKRRLRGMALASEYHNRDTRTLDIRFRARFRKLIPRLVQSLTRGRRNG